MPNTVNDAGTDFNPTEILPFSPRLEAVSGRLFKKRLRRHACRSHGHDNDKAADQTNLEPELRRLGILEREAADDNATSTDDNFRWYVKSLNFYWLEETSSSLILDRSLDRSSIFVRDCGKCGCRQELPACRRCGGDAFGVFRIRGNMHGIFCKECSLGVDRWECSDCHTSNLCDHTIKQLVKERPHRAPANDKKAPEDRKESSFWNYLFALIILAMIAYQMLPSS